MRSPADYDTDTGTFHAVRTLRESGNSRVLTMPPLILQAANLEGGDEIDIVADPETGEITMTKSPNNNDTE